MVKKNGENIDRVAQNGLVPQIGVIQVSRYKQSDSEGIAWVTETYLFTKPGGKLFDSRAQAISYARENGLADINRLN
jgi:hypothetical protein